MTLRDLGNITCLTTRAPIPPPHSKTQTPLTRKLPTSAHRKEEPQVTGPVPTAHLPKDQHTQWREEEGHCPGGQSGTALGTYLGEAGRASRAGTHLIPGRWRSHLLLWAAVPVMRLSPC